MLGRLADSGLVVREDLSHTGLPNPGAQVRLSAALLSIRIGDLDAAQLHLERAKELIPNLEHRRWLAAPPVLLEYLLAKREPKSAIDLLSRTFNDHAIDPYFSGEMLTWGVRAAADLAETARDRHDANKLAAADAALDELMALRAKLPEEPFQQVVPEDMWQPAWEALFQAELQRCIADGSTSGAWRTATQRCEAAGMRWEQAIASWRCAQALLAEGADPSTAAVPLRSAHQFAADADAALLLRDIEALAATCRIPLDEPTQPTEHVTEAAPFSTLTKREHEVLSHLVAGRTYSEIAEALFISDKTVSAHVSNLLRKTGTSSRREVSALALRTGQSPQNPEAR